MMWVVWVVGEGGVGAHHPTWGFMFLIFFTQVESFVDIWTSTLTVGVVHRHGGMDVVRRGHTVCHRRRKHLSVRIILDLQFIPMMGQPVVKEDRLSVTILFCK